MELINNRYKILECLENEHCYAQYIALDLLRKGEKVTLYLIRETVITKPFIEYCNYNFYEISSYKQSSIISVYSYGVVDTIDGKQTAERLFFYTTEYVASISLTDINNPLKEDELLDIYKQLARALDFLHYRGIVYKYIGVETVKIIKTNGKYVVKLLDIVSIYRMEIVKTYYHPLTYNFIAPEVERGMTLGNYTDIYSLGSLIYYLITLEPLQHNSLNILVKNYTNYKYDNFKLKFLKLIRKMTSADIDTRYTTIHQCNNIVKEIYKLDEVIENIKDVDKINFKIPLIGRENELKQILNTYNITKGKIGKFNKELVLISGDKGIGKTRLMREVCNLMTWDNCRAFSITINRQKERFEVVISHILKQFIKIATDENIIKYGNELVKIVPQLAADKGIVPSKVLPEKQEKLRLYDRVSNFILDVALNNTIAILLDDFHFADKYTVEFIDYLLSLNKTRKASILFILAFNDEQYCYIKSNEYINKWTYYNTLNIKLSRLTIEETAKMVKHILGWYEEPLNYASRIMADTEGVPGHIEYIMKELYSQGLLKIGYSSKHKEFAPKINLDDYDKIILTQNIDTSTIKFLQSLDSTTREILNIVSLFNTAVSKDIITAMLQIDEDKYYNQFLSLTQLNILCEKFDDWGYTYGFCNSSFKKYVYNAIEDTKREKLHMKASNILEESYIKEGRENKDELIYHFIQSSQKDKAIDYCIQSGINMLKLFVYGQSYSFFKRAYELLENEEDSRKLTVVFYLAKVNQHLLKNNDAIYYFEYAIELANLQNSQIKFIDAKNEIATIYLIKGKFDLAKRYLIESIEGATKINYVDGIMEAAYLLTKLYMQIRKFEKMKTISEKYFDYASEQGNLYYMGTFMIQRGTVEHFYGNIKNALYLFEESIHFLEKANKPEKTSKPISNIGVIYNEYFQDTHNAIVYFEKALSIAEQYHKIDDIIVFNTNIARSYIASYNYYDAINILKKNLELAQNYGDEISILQIYTNLIKCYTNIGEYKQAHIYLLRGEDICKNRRNNYNGMCIEPYVEACVNLYVALGAYNKALTLIEEFFKKFSNIEQSMELRMKKMHYFAKYYNGDLVEKRELIGLIESYNKTPFIRDKRTILLEGAIHYAKRFMTTETKCLLDNDKHLINSVDNEYFILKRKFAESFLLTEEQQIVALENLFLDKNLESFKELQWQIYAQLGDLHLKKKQYYNAINSFLDALSIIYVLFNKVPSQFQKVYLLQGYKFKIRNNLLNMQNLINNNKIDKIDEGVFADNYAKYSKKILDEKDFEQFFSLLESQNILENKEIYKLALESYDKINKTRITNIKSLLQSLTNDNIVNLNFLLQLVCRTALATNGVIIAESESKYEVITAVGQDIPNSKVNNILDAISSTNNEIIIKGNLDMIRGFDKNTRALIILPIYKEDKSVKNIDIEVEKRKKPNKPNRKIIGYLYLETNRTLNNFSKETLKICKTVTPLASVLITNYHLEVFSSIDKLTGTYVRKYFEQIFDEQIQHAKANDYYLSVIMLDIDHFKNVNDTYGHQKGDDVLAQTGKIILENVRSTDYVGRYGGEEFIALLPNANKEDVYNIAEKIREKIEKSNLIGDGTKLTISCGTATFPQDGNEQLDIIEKADQALYMAKESGRNQTVQWKQGIDLKNKRVDKLAGIVTGNIVQDQRNVLVITEIIELISSSNNLEDKIYAILGRLSEMLEAESGILFTVTDGKIEKEYYRKRFVDGWAPMFTFNKELVENTINTMQGKYIIDWEDISSFDPLTNIPNWKSVIVVPIVVKNAVCGVIYLSVPIKEKEFDYNAYNLVKITSNIIGAILKIEK